jgi:hypothetical protein
VFGLACTARWPGHYCGVAHRTAPRWSMSGWRWRWPASRSWPRRWVLCGWLSYSQVRAISWLAPDGGHRLVEDLIDAAGHGTVGQLEVLFRGLRTVADVDNPDRHPQEYVSHSWSSGACRRGSTRNGRDRAVRDRDDRWRAEPSAVRPSSEAETPRRVRKPPCGSRCPGHSFAPTRDRSSRRRPNCHPTSLGRG